MIENFKSMSLDRTASAYICFTGEEKLAELLELLGNKGLVVATAESCTGGLIGKIITDVPGSSAVYAGGVISYTNDIKIKALGVMPETINTYTEVSRQTACEMAEGVREKFSADIGISTTGYAGPSGGTEDEPCGTVYICVASRDEVQVLRVSFDPEASRDEIRKGSAYLSLEIVGRMVKNL